MPKCCQFFLTFLVLSMEVVTVRPLMAQVDVLTHRYDNARSGVNLKESTLTKANVNARAFGKLAFRIVDGNIYAQLLIVTGARIVNHPNPVDVAIVATEHNSFYAFDTNDTSPDPGGQVSGKALWHTGPATLGNPVDSLELSQKIGAGNCIDLTTEIGITGTPVIRLTSTTSPKQGVIFVAAKSKSGAQFSYKLFALNLSDGTPMGNGVTIEGSVASPNGTITFDPLFQLNRPALLLDGNTLYIAFGGHCDAGDYRGWLFAYDVSDPAAPKKLDVFCSTFTRRTQNPDDKNGRGGIWMSGYGPAGVDGGAFFVTGDGSYSTANPNFPELSNSVIRVAIASGKIQVQDWFTPQNRDELKTFDVDLGSAGAVPVPNSHLLLAGGKEGRMYLIDRNDMGRGKKVSLHSFQATEAPHDRVDHPQMAGDRLYWNIHGTPILWPGNGQTFVYVMGEEGTLKQYRLVPDPGPTGWKFDSDMPFRQSRETPGLPPPNILNDPRRPKVWMPGGFLTLSANGADPATGIVWAAMPFNGAVLLGRRSFMQD